MAQTWNTPEGSKTSGADKRVDQDRARSVADGRARDRARRRWKLHQRFRTARRISVALDQRCGIEIPEPGTVQIDYRETGLNLGFVERRAAGVELFAAERAA